MSGPYFKGQEVEKCGCYYPDVTLIRDDPNKGTRIFFVSIMVNMKSP